MDPAREPQSAFDADAPRSADQLFVEVYDRLKAMAGRRLAAGPRGTLDTTGLVHELYLRMNAGERLRFSHPAQFFTYAARAMRHLLTDRARVRLSQRAGGEWLQVTLTGSDPDLAIASAEQALALDEGLQRLEREDARAAQVVELLYFGGLTLEEVARTLDVARRTVDRDWRWARAFLKAELD
ncbi:MAG: ECF-type sigma factor [Pseudoxanthomonas sp.]|nr:ECF-type sigma factor [Pseudoxanthomonas sp.]